VTSPSEVQCAVAVETEFSALWPLHMAAGEDDFFIFSVQTVTKFGKIVTVVIVQ